MNYKQFVMEVDETETDAPERLTTQPGTHSTVMDNAARRFVDVRAGRQDLFWFSGFRWRKRASRRQACVPR